MSWYCERLIERRNLLNKKELGATSDRRDLFKSFVENHSCIRNVEQNFVKAKDNLKFKTIIFALICVFIAVVLSVAFHLVIFKNIDEITEEFEVEKTIETKKCYTTMSGYCYHASGCGSLWNSSYETTVYKAEKNGYKPCNKCTPKETVIVDVIEIETRIVESSFISFGIPILISVFISFVLFAFLIFKSFKNFSFQKEEMARLKLSSESILDKIKSKDKEIELIHKDMTIIKAQLFEWENERYDLIKSIGNQTIFEYAGVGEDIVVNSQGCPVGTPTNPSEYIVYTCGYNGRTYHSKECRYGFTELPLLKAQKKHLNCCTLCLPPYMDFSLGESIENRMHCILDELRKYDINIKFEDSEKLIYPSTRISTDVL